MQRILDIQQKMLSLSECEGLCSRGSEEVEVLARRAGWRGLPGTPVNVSVERALNMLALSTTMRNGVEPQSISAHLPALRHDALLRLAGNASNWSFVGSANNERDFWSIFYGSPLTVRTRVGPLFGISVTFTYRYLRFHSQSDIECVGTEYSANHSAGRIPRFIIDSHALAVCLSNTCTGPLFTASDKKVIEARSC